MTVIFKTEEERENALAEIPINPPNGTDNINAWLAEQEAKVDEIMKAPIGEQSPEEMSATPQKADAPLPNVQNDDATIKALDYERQKAKNLERQLNETNTRLAEFEKKIEMMVSQHKPKDDEKQDQTSSEIAQIKSELTTLQAEANLYNDDTEPLKMFKNSTKQLQLERKLNALREANYKKNLDIYGNEIEGLKKKTTEKEKKKQLEAQERERLSLVEKFKNSKEYPEFNSDKSYAQMKKEYYDFGAEVAAAYFNTTPNQVKDEDIEVAMQTYLAGSQILEQKLKARGQVEPQDMRKFVVLSEIDALEQGVKLDKNTGKWVALQTASGNRVSFPDLKSAYNHLKMENGQYGQELLQAQKDSQNELKKALNQRSNPVELDKMDQKKTYLEEMPKERADKILQEWSLEMIAQRKYEDPIVAEYNKALSALGHRQLTPEDFE